MIKYTTVRDTFLGVAIGDAFGLGLEFQNRQWIKDNVDFTKFINKREGKYAHGYEDGFYSDDTEHTIGVVKALMDPNIFSEELLLEYWKKEYFSDMKQKGFFRQGHGSIKEWYEGTRSIEEIRESQKKREKPGNAPPMRSIPFGFLNETDMENYATINAKATHPHPSAVLASKLIARATKYLVVEKKNPDILIKHCIQSIDDNIQYQNDINIIEALEKVDTLGPFETLKDKDFELLCGEQPVPYFKIKDGELYGLPCSSLETAISSLYILKHSSDTFSGLKSAIRLGGDVDSIAAICTGILGGRYGLSSIPQFMIDKVEGYQMLEELARDFTYYLNNQYNVE